MNSAFQSPETPPITLKLERTLQTSIGLSWQMAREQKMQGVSEFRIEYCKVEGFVGLGAVTAPPENSFIQSVSVTKGNDGVIRSLSPGQKYLVSVVGKKRLGRPLRSHWTVMSTLDSQGQPMGASINKGSATQERISIDIRVKQQFEECIGLNWSVVDNKIPANTMNEFVVEMVIDRSDPLTRHKDEGKLLRPPKDAMVKQVSMGLDMEGFIQNMPEARDFMVSVVGKTRAGGEIRSPWIRTSTLNPKTRPSASGGQDILGVKRGSCSKCRCAGYVPDSWSLNSAEKMRCRRCACLYTEHAAVEVGAILSARQAKASEYLRRPIKKNLPQEALEWDNRECMIWFLTDGLVHPRTTVAEYRQPPALGSKVPVGGPEGVGGKKGRVSVVTPTTDSRHQFHEALWRCFEAQAWPDKELVVVETYVENYSKFFALLAESDPRVVYIKFQRPKGQDWSIGLKRNLGAHLATGEFIANFDDDDLYAPAYVSSMVSMLEEREAQAITLSSWFVYDRPRKKWNFCDPIAWGLTKGKDESTHDVRTWAYGYGFSYVYRRRAGLDIMYDDINMGEDFNFMSALQNRRGQKSVTLFHDDFGICLHLQHGGNTSNSIPLREVDHEERRNLDIMELAPHFAHFRGAASEVFLAEPPPSQRHRSVKAYLPDLQADVSCAISATTEEFLRCLGATTASDVSTMRVFRVPPDADATDSRSEKLAIEVMGLTFLAEMPGAEHNIRPEGKCGRQWRQLLEQAKRPMHQRDRIGLRTNELWVRSPEAAQADTSSLQEEEDDEHVIVHATCEKSSVKKFFSASGSFQVHIPKGATVGQFRSVVGSALPSTAKVMAELPGKGLCTLRDEDRVPLEVTLSDFKGRRGVYLRFTTRMNLVAFTMIKEYFLKPESQEMLDKLQRECQGDDLRYSISICSLLSDEAYPPILRHFSLPEDQQPLQLMIDAMDNVGSSVETTSLWLETEVLMRNRMKAEEAFKTLCTLHRGHGIPEPEPPQLLAVK